MFNLILAVKFAYNANRVGTSHDDMTSGNTLAVFIFRFEPLVSFGLWAIRYADL